MSDAINDLLRPPQAAAVWGLRERQARHILGELEALGFKLTPGSDGARLIRPELAAAVKVCRSQKKELATMRLDPNLARYLTPGAAADENDPLGLLIHVMTEVSICREVIATGVNALATGMAVSSYRPFSWSNNGLPDPRHSL